MRARLQKYLPIVLIALAMQVLAPIAACWAATGAAAPDPLQNAVICHSGDASAGGSSDQTGAHALACSMCCLAQANAALDSPRVAFVTPDRATAAAGWPQTRQAAVSSHRGSNTQARAPPEHS